MQHAPPRILVAGIGNIFLGDDAFGSEVAQRLLRRTFPSNVTVCDFGIRGLDLVYALLDDYDAAILIDAVPRPGHAPGTLYLLEPRMADLDETSPPMIDAHSMDPMKVLRTAASMGVRPRKILIVGCQPGELPDDDAGETPLGMSPPMTASIEPAIEMVEQLLEQLLAADADLMINHNPQEVPCSR